MQMTTREAVEEALYCMAEAIGNSESFGEDQCKIRNAMLLICSQYGFKIDQFFDVEETA